MDVWRGVTPLLRGLRASARENATAYGFSIMITASFGVLTALDGPPEAWETFLFAFGAVAGFTTVLGLARVATEEGEAEATEIVVVAALLNFASVLAAVGAAGLVGWAGHGWAVWLAGPLAASATYLLLNGLEHALAEKEEES